jgi:exo-beta-1,3-glucanase (GH17 family)
LISTALKRVAYRARRLGPSSKSTWCSFRKFQPAVPTWNFSATEKQGSFGELVPEGYLSSMHLNRRQLLATGIAATMPFPAQAQVLRADLTLLQTAMARGRFVTYQPTGLMAIDGILTPTNPDSISADLKVLRPHFDSLITYGALAGNEMVPDIAASLGFRAVVIGVWDGNDPREVGNAVAAWKRNPKIVAGIGLGNEVMLGKRGAWSDLADMLDRARQLAPGLPLSTTESFAQFLDDPEAQSVLARMDFMLVNIHPIFESWFKTAPAFNRADFVGRVVERLAQKYSGPILVKETGTPTGPAAAGFNEDIQSDFYRALERRFPPNSMGAFSYFSAFDAPWRTQDFTPTPGAHEEEAHWGIFAKDRRPKKVIGGIPPFPR